MWKRWVRFCGWLDRTLPGYRPAVSEWATDDGAIVVRLTADVADVLAVTFNGQELRRKAQ